MEKGLIARGKIVPIQEPSLPICQGTRHEATLVFQTSIAHCPSPIPASHSSLTTDL